MLYTALAFHKAGSPANAGTQRLSLTAGALSFGAL